MKCQAFFSAEMLVLFGALKLSIAIGHFRVKL